MTPDQIKAARARLGLTQAQFAALLPVSIDTLQNWEAGRSRRNPPPYLERAIRDLERERQPAAT